MKLATLLRRSGTAEEFTDTYNTGASRSESDDSTALRREWDQLRGSAGSEAERKEIDAVFSRVMP